MGFWGVVELLTAVVCPVCALRISLGWFGKLKIASHLVYPRPPTLPKKEQGQTPRQRSRRAVYPHLFTFYSSSYDKRP
jgi:hypothetical protein